jgi:hypothetical protein
MAAAAGPFDCSIEVSGNPRALQSAIDHTSNNGRIVVGSWYGNTEVVLKLGIDFHRSNKAIVASQVSTLRAGERCIRFPAAVSTKGTKKGNHFSAFSAFVVNPGSRRPLTVDEGSQMTGAERNK